MRKQCIEKSYLGVAVTPRFVFYFLFLLAITVYGLSFVRRLASPFKYLVSLLLIVVLSETMSRISNFYYGTSVPVYHFLLPLLIAHQSIIYSFVLPKKFSGILYSAMTLGILFSILNSIFYQTIFAFPSNSLLLTSLIVVGFSLLHFYDMLQRPGTHSPLKESFFWLSSGNLFFYCITFFIFGFFNPFLRRQGALPEWGYDIIFVSNLLLYLSYFMCLRLALKNKTKHELS